MDTGSDNNVVRVLNNTPLVILTFLQQQGFDNEECQRELDSLSRDLKITPDINCNSPGNGSHDDGELQTDGHFSSSIRGLVDDIQPQAYLNRHGDEVQGVRNVAADLILIAHQLEQRVVAKATENLTKKLQTSSVWFWKNHMAVEVDWVLSQGLYSLLDHLPKERVIMALALTLVKGVCEKAPGLLRGLFSTALEYFGSR
ncbi:BH3 interacting domain death agonist [Hypomesus transpacificus]|uniref:BH3 interacting domain death agonist n=1 Tax=Hypomesus transpacificus TaxID=137520 RepID=UPI001F077CB8|nr:BH3 interacting domain death agonist [Hypomesus transpacificus]XP_046889596.1 BH3 interacting domain death agonist [Hypomesus transpacificus]